MVYICFTLNFQVFKQSYEFVEEVKSKEREHLKKELANEQDEERIKQIKYLIQRMVCFCLDIFFWNFGMIPKCLICSCLKIYGTFFFISVIVYLTQILS